MHSTATDPMKGNTARRVAAGCTILFALPFLAIGIGALFLDTPASGSAFPRYATKAVGLIFALSGVSMVVSAISRFRKVTQQAAMVASAPEQPWRWRKDWGANRCEDRLARSLAGVWIFGITWTLLSSFALVILPEALARGQKLALLVVIFPLIGIGVLAIAIYQTIRAMKFGPSVLELSTNPYVPGRTAAGTVRVKMREVPENGFAVALRQIHAVTTGTGKSRRTRETVEWQHESRVARGAVPPSADGLRIPVQFRIPEDAQETDDSNARDRRLWRMDITADMSGVDYAASFEVPVYRGA